MKKYVLIGLLILFILFVIYLNSSSHNEYIDDECIITHRSIGLESSLEPISVKDNNNLKIILINLDKRKDRLQSAIKSYNESDLNSVTDLYRLPAVDGRKQIETILPHLSRRALKEFNMYKDVGQRVGHHSLTEGGMGCYMSHVLAWQKIQEFEIPCIVAEDDIFIPKDTYKNIIDVMNLVDKIPKTRPYIVLFHCTCDSLIWDKLECVPVQNGVYNAKQFWGTAFYYVTPEAAEVMLDNVLPVKYQIDHAMSVWNQQGLIDIFYVKNLIGMGVFDTDIQVPVFGNIF